MNNKKTPTIRLKDPNDPSVIERKRIQAEKKREQRKRSIDKMSEEERGAFWKKEYMRTGTSRKKKLQNEEARKEYLEKDKRRKKEKKMKEREEVVDGDNGNYDNPIGSYQRRQSLGKAVARVTKSLPSSPSKQRALVIGLAERIGLALEKKMNRPVQHSPDSALVQLVKNFYFRHDIAYTMPGKDALITVWNKGFGRQRLRRHYMNMFIREAHAVFLSTLEDGQKCSLSWFRQQRPQNVLLLENTPMDTCKCIIHTNFQLKLDALGMPYENAMWDSLLCDSSPNSRCWLGECDECSSGNKLKVKRDLEAMVDYAQWEHVYVPDKKSKMKDDEDDNEEPPKLVRILEKKTNNVERGNVLEEFKSSFEVAAKHTNVKRIQSEDFLLDKETPNVRVLQIDFAMSYQCAEQNECQGKI